jgi:hypothetical protein
MPEIVCSSCGAVFFGAADASVCSHCGQNPQKTPWKRISSLASDNFSITLWVVYMVIWFRPERNDWEQDAVFLALAIGAAATVMYARKTQGGGKGSVTALNLNQRETSTDSLESSWTPPPPPRVPDKWSHLMSATRPRDVFWPVLSQVRAAVNVAFIFVSLGYVTYLVHGHHASFSDWGREWPRNLFVFAVTAISDLFVFAGLYQKISNRHLLRDGEVTMGSIVDWVQRKRAVPIAVYQFWTRSGERFEHRGQVRSSKNEYSAPGVVPVFYLPQDPTKSLALCSTQLRVRVPNDDFVARAERMGLKS